MISNYEKDRTNLKEGDPCPLCFSKDHPFRNQTFKPFVQKAKSELDIAKEQYDKIYQNHRTLLRRQDSLDVQIEQLEGNEVKKLHGQLQRHLEKLWTYEEKISKITSVSLKENAGKKLSSPSKLGRVAIKQ